MFERIGQGMSRFWWLTIFLWAALALGMSWLAPRWDSVTRDGDLDHLPRTATSVLGHKRLDAAFSNARSKSELVVVIERRDAPLDAGDVPLIQELVTQLRALQSELAIDSVWSPIRENDPTRDAIAEQLNSSDGQAARILVRLKTEFMSIHSMRVFERVQALLGQFEARPDFPRQRLGLGITGSAAIAGDMLNAAAESIRRTEVVTVVLVALILLLVYRAPLLTVIPIVTISVSILVATSLVALLSHWSSQTGWLEFKLFKTTKIFVVTILFGSGTDFCLFLISRYREELGRGRVPAAAMTQALSRVGGALSASALTTIFGLATMVFAEFGKFRNSGPALAICLSVAFAACITLAPALLRAAGPLLFWPFGRRALVPALDGSSPTGGEPAPAEAVSAGGMGFSWTARFWERASAWIVSHPGAILGASVLVLLPCAWRGWSVRTNFDVLNELGPDRPSVLGTAMMRRHFPAGDAGPITVVATHQAGRLDNPAGEQKIDDLTLFLRQSPGVVTVRSWTAPLGEPLKPLGIRGVFEKQIKLEEGKPRYISQVEPWAGKVTRLEVVLEHHPFSVAGEEGLDQLSCRLRWAAQGEGPTDFLDGASDEALAVAARVRQGWSGAEFDFVGPTASTADLRRVTTSDQTRIQWLCVAAVFLVLWAILRRPLVCAYLMVSVVFSYLVSIGGIHWLFEMMLGDNYAGLDWKVPLFLFVILVACGVDYNVYLVTRFYEEQRRLGALAGLREALRRTGGIITSCGIIMAGTFVSMTTGSLRGMLELGLALTLGVLVDTFVVRTLIVPAFLALTYRGGEGEAGEILAPWPSAETQVPLRTTAD